MKKALLIVLTLALVLALAACGGDADAPATSPATTPNVNADASTPPPAQDDDNAQSDALSVVDEPGANTVAGYLAQFGFTEDGIKPDGFTSFDGPNGWLIKIYADADSFENWSKTIFGKVKSISADGKIYNEGYPSLDEDEAVWSEGGISFQWAYNYGGKVVNLTIVAGEDGTEYRFSIY